MNTALRFRRPGCGRGQVLIEILTALTVFTMAAFSLIVALNSTFDAVDSRNHIETAVQGLENQAALLHAAPLIMGDRDLAADGTGVLYHVSVQPEQVNDQKGQPVPSLYRAIITATWIDRGQQNQRTLSELIYQP